MPLVDRDDSVLVVVDVQPGFIAHPLLNDDERKRADRVVDRIAWLTTVATLVDVPVMVVEEGSERNGPTDQRVVQRLTPGTAVHSRDAFSVAASDDAMRALTATGRRTVVLVGFETDVCVMQSAVDLFDRGFRVVVVDDGTFSAGRDHGRGLRRATQAGAELNHCKGLALEWLRTVDYARRIWKTTTERLGPFPLGE